MPVFTAEPTPEALRRARRQLSRFVAAQAELTADYFGFGWRASDLAPATFAALQNEFRCCVLTHAPLRVSSHYCDNVIFSSPTINHANRFWHDMTHIRLGAGFDDDGESRVANAHLNALEAVGWPPSSLVWRLLHADTLGQLACRQQTGDFPRRQREFDVRCAVEGLEAAVAAVR